MRFPCAYKRVIRGMKEIIDGKLYDTKKSEKICDINFTTHSIWRTQKGSLFLFNNMLMRISNVNQDILKNLLGKENPEKYIELYGDIEEA